MLPWWGRGGQGRVSCAESRARGEASGAEEPLASEGNPNSTLISPPLPAFLGGGGCCTEPYLQNLKQGGGVGVGGRLQRLEATLGRGGRAEAASLAGA